MTLGSRTIRALYTLLGLVLGSVVTWGSARAADAGACGDDIMLLAVRLNGADIDDAVQARHCGGILALPRGEWQRMRLRAPVGNPSIDSEGGAWHRLDQLAGLDWRLDEATQTLVIDAAPSAFNATRLDASARNLPAPAATNWGGYVNYDMVVDHTASFRGGNSSRAFNTQGVVELGLFGPPGNGRFSGLLRDNGTQPQAVRLDTNWTQDQPSSMSSLRLGDGISHGGSWGRPLRFGGVQWATDFSTQPGFLTFLLPAVKGEAALPSTVDVFVNNSRRLQGEVPAGPFDLADVPLVTGNGEVRMVVHDLLGREQVVVMPYFVSPQLLKPGLRSFSYELGLVREDYGLESNHYGRPMVSLTDKMGVTPGFTRELRAEALGRQLAAGASGLWLLPSVGTLRATAVASHGPGGRGAMLSFAADHQGRDWSASLDLKRATPAFAQMGTLPGNAPQWQASASAGGSVFGTSVAVSLMHQQPWQGETQRLATLSASHAFGARYNLSLGVIRDLNSGATSASLAFNVSFGNGLHGSASHARSNDGLVRASNLQLQKSRLEGEGLDYQIGADQGDSRRLVAEAQWAGTSAQLSAGMAHTPSGNGYRAGVSGAAAWLGDSLFFTRRIDGSFAVVEVGGYPGIGLLKENQLVARTGADGRALVSGLRGYERNRISIDPANLPLDAEVDTLEVAVVPPARSGMAIRFPVRAVRSARFRIVDLKGVNLPPGASMRVEGQGDVFPVGYEGHAWLSGLARRNIVRAEWPGGRCTAELVLRDDADPLADLGAVPCR